MKSLALASDTMAGGGCMGVCAGGRVGHACVPAWVRKCVAAWMRACVGARVRGCVLQMP